ncbi:MULTISPECIES: hypothetical protein [unclassified Nostoc]|uniref:hypothetical protein n=1 Tax=unclassified Nostoc TaxID=2593658 RepID=UPI002AD3F03C|nr:hypothetical protein [Nostoc sp. DedQUE03]MDZ7976298.1 hypothetical protein [Nostoc sp. DedQUE03]MDZ8044899.1 hypothetical protein [Nostoc sp. DedQUE02]
MSKPAEIIIATVGGGSGAVIFGWIVSVIRGDGSQTDCFILNEPSRPTKCYDTATSTKVTQPTKLSSSPSSYDKLTHKLINSPDLKPTELSSSPTPTNNVEKVLTIPPSVLARLSLYATPKETPITEVPSLPTGLIPRPAPEPTGLTGSSLLIIFFLIAIFGIVGIVAIATKGTVIHQNGLGDNSAGDKVAGNKVKKK